LQFLIVYTSFMKKLTRLFKLKWFPRFVTTHAKGTLTSKSANMKTETRTFFSMPKTFDFTAYFDDNELENNTVDISNENPAVATNTETFF
jgi:hypothetical protein